MTELYSAFTLVYVAVSRVVSHRLKFFVLYVLLLTLFCT